MFRRVLYAVVLGVASCGVAAADEFYALITKLEDGKVTFRRREKFKEGMKRVPYSRTEEALPAAPDIKVRKGKHNQQTTPPTIDEDGELPGGLNNKGLKDIDRFALPIARIRTDDKGEKIKEVWVFFPPPPQQR